MNQQSLVQSIQAGQEIYVVTPTSSYVMLWRKFDGTYWGRRSDGIDEQIGGGSSDKNFVLHQTVSALVWSVPHNLNKRCAVQIVDNSFHEIEGDIRWVNDNEVEVTFNSAKTGYVYCN